MFTEKTKLGEVYDIKRGQEILAKFAVPCVTCPMARMELDLLNLGQIAEMYDIDLVGLLKELNELKKKKWFIKRLIKLQNQNYQ